MVVEGIVAFSNLTKHEEYLGKSTGRYGLTVTIGDDVKAALMQKGVKIKEYKDTFQRKFRSQYTVPVVDAEDNPVEGEIPWGSKVRLSINLGKPSPVHGVTPYLQAVRILERSDNDAGGFESGF